MLQLTGEISTFTNDKRRPSKISIYKHDNLYESFSSILKELRHSLSMVLEQNAVAIHLTNRGHGIWIGDISDKALLKNSNFVLAVYADMPSEWVRNHFPTHVKISAVEMLQNLVSRSLPGIGLEAMAVAPRQIPYHANFSYFSLNQHHEYWESLQHSSGIGFHVSGNFPGLKLELSAIKG